MATPLKSLDSETIFYMLLENLEVMSITGCMSSIEKAITELDWNQMKNDAHSLKGASGIVGAGRVHYACFFIEEAY